MSGSPDDDRVLVEVADRLATVTLNRPGKLNAIDFETYEILERLSAELSGRDDVGAVVLTGAGRAFSAGADLSQFADNMDFDDPHAVRERLQYVGSVVAKWVHLDKPTVAAVNGIALGGGANLALCCDLLLMREDAAIGQSYVQRGLSVDMGGPGFCHGSSAARGPRSSRCWEISSRPPTPCRSVWPTAASRSRSGRRPSPIGGAAWPPGRGAHSG